MLFKDPDAGLIPYMKDCLKGAVYGDPKTRVTLAADFDIYLQGQSKMTVPTIVVTPGPATIQELSTPGTTIVRQYFVEQIDIAAILDAKRDKVGNFPVDDVHQVRIDLLRCLLGFNAFIHAQCNSIVYGYSTLEIRYQGDDWFAFDRERYVHEFNFTLWSEINSIEQGVGASFPAAINDLNNIFATIEPSEIDVGDGFPTEVTVPTPPASP